MKRTELERRLKKAGWVIRPGGKHNIAERADKPGVMITIPRGSKINELTARGILKDTGLI